MAIIFLEFYYVFLLFYFLVNLLTISNQIEKFKNYVIISDNGWSISSNYQNYKNIIKEISLEEKK